MVLGLRSKHRKGASVQVDYLVHVEDINPWPPSHSLRSVQSILLQWQNGDHNSGSLTSSVGDDNIEFNMSFTLPLTLCREKKAHDKFQKNFLEFSLYEPRKDKVAKGQLLGTAIINLADYGIIEDVITISAPVNCKKNSKNTVQPVLFLKIQPIDKISSSSSPKISLSKEASVENEGRESASELMNEENDDESEIASFTDDDVSSHSSRTIASSAFEAVEASHYQSEKVVSDSATKDIGRANTEPVLPLVVEPLIPILNPATEAFKQPTGSSHTLSSKDWAPDPENLINNHASMSNFPEQNIASIKKEYDPPVVQSSSSSLQYRDTNRDSRDCMRCFEQENTSHNIHKNVAPGNGKIEENTMQSAKEDFDRLTARVATSRIEVGVNSDTDSCIDDQPSQNGNELVPQQIKVEATTVNDLYIYLGDGKEKMERRGVANDEKMLEEKTQAPENKIAGNVSQDATKKQGTLKSTILTSRVVGVQGTTLTNSKLKHVKSAHFPIDPAKANMFYGNSQNTKKVKKIGSVDDAHSNLTSSATTGRKEPTNSFSGNKTEWKSRTEMLEEELREAAALEVGLYSVVAEHGSSTNKVHAPARRLSRFYFHACKARSQDKRASAARAVTSGLVLVSKACGNDVPRLTFWLSNSIMLRAIVSQAVREISLIEPHNKSSGGGNGSDGRSLRKWDKSSPSVEDKSKSREEFDDWEDPITFTIALEKVEAWIFYRIVESVWWQTLTPHMQPTVAKSSRTMSSSSRKTNGSRYVLGDQEQGNFSVELWKRAFKDACERLCPIRAGGHECGCLPVLARLVMEQLVSRLDVAMFNAILRESAEEMPTDPVSDPIADSKVLPVPSGRSSFGSGAQLKNAIGNWSRWLTDLFGIEDNDSLEDTDNLGDDKRLEFDTSFKPFRLLNALSDLMMLPFEMLADTSTRKEVCPTFSAPLIKRVFNNFVPDEFCPEPFPDSVFDALDSEDAVEAAEETLTGFPCTASCTVYSPPAAASLSGILGEVGSQSLRRSGSSVLRKAYTSDDELEELDSPLTSIIGDKLPKGKGGRNVVRYQLLREVWRDGE